MRVEGIGWFLVCVSLVFVTGCSGSSGSMTNGGGTGGGGGGVIDPDPDPEPESEPVIDPLNIVSADARADYLGPFQDAFHTVKDSARDGGLTSFVNLPSPGSSSYQGYMELSFFSMPSASIRGTTSLTVDMQTGATAGNATGFMGSVLDSAEVMQIVSFEGDVALSGGTLGAASNGAASYSLLIDGDLDNGVQTFAINGQLKGFLYGATGEGIVVSGGSNVLKNDIATVIDGTAVDGVATLWALRPADLP